MCTSVLLNREASRASEPGVALEVAHGGLGALAHRLAEQAGEGELALAGHAGGLDEEDLAADRGPGQSGGHAGNARAVDQLAEEPRRAQQLGELGGPDGDHAALALGPPAGDLAADGRDLALEVAQAGLARVVGDDLLERQLGDLDVRRIQPVGLELLGDDVLLGDQRLLLLAVAGKLEHFHPVQQGGGDRLEHVGGGDEHDLGEVEVDVEVMVAEGGVLLRVEDLEQGGRGVAPKIGAQLVDLVEHEDRVVGRRPCECPG